MLGIIKGVRIGGKFISLDEVKLKLEKLKAYEESELSPEEVHMAMERLTKFELAGVAPGEVTKLAERDNAITTTVDEYGLMWCPLCGALVGTVSRMEGISFCRDCGQRLTVPVHTKLVKRGDEGE